MAGHVRKRGASWELRAFLGRDPLDGKRLYATRTMKGTKREAERALAAFVAEAERGVLATAGVLVGELLERWFEHARGDFSPKTVLETRGVIDRYLLPALGSTRLTKLHTADLDRFYRELCARGGKSGKALSPATVRRIHGILRRSLTQGVRWGWLSVNPAASASPPRVLTPDITPPAPRDIARLFALANESDPDLAMFVVLAAATGARRSELVALRWLDIDLGVGSVSIGRGLVSGPDGLVMKDTKTHSARRVSLDPTSLGFFRAYRVVWDQRVAHAEALVRDDAYVFSHVLDGSAPWRPDSTTRAFARLCRRAGIEGVRLHDLRHYVATQMLAAGVDVRTVAGRLGHRNAATTLNVYSHFLPEADRQAAGVLGRLFDEAVAAERPAS